jgi:hypothetical protein
MTISIIDWAQELSCTNIDKTVGIQIATLLESESRRNRTSKYDASIEVLI